MSTSEAQTDNMGGIQQIWPVAVSSILNFTDIYDSEIHTFSVENGTTLDPLYVVSDTIKFKQEKKTSTEGTWFDTKLEVDAPKDRLELQNFMVALETNQYIVVVKDNNGQYKVIGTPDEPMNIDIDLDSGQVEGALNSYRISFSRKLRERSPFSDALPVIADPT